VNPFAKHIEGFRQRKSERIIHTISFEEIEKIKKLKDLPEGARNHPKVDAYRVLHRTTGKRSTSMTSENVRPAANGVYIDITQQKTNKYVTIGVSNPTTVNVIENSFPRPMTAIYFNRFIKEVCKLAGMTQTVRGDKNNPATRRKENGDFPKYELMCAHDLRDPLQPTILEKSKLRY
jgi:hypothetical protein